MYLRPNFTLSNVTETKTFMYQYNLLKPITEMSALDLVTMNTINAVDTVGFTLKQTSVYNDTDKGYTPLEIL